MLLVSGLSRRAGAAGVGRPRESAASWSLAATGRQQQAAELVKDALTKVTDPAGRAALALRQAEDLWWWARNQAAALAALDAAVTELGPGEWADMLRVQPSVFSAMNGDGRKAVELALLFAEHDVLRVRLVAAIGLGFGLVLCDRGSEAIDIADKAFADALTDPTHELSGDPTIHIVCRLFAGLYGPNAEETLELATSIYAVAVQQPSQQSRAWAALLLGLAHFAHGHPISAARFCTEAELLWSDCAIQGLARWSASATVLAHLSLGDPTAARETFDRMSTYDQTGFAFNASFEDRAAAHFAVRDGRTDDATDILVAAAQREAARGTHILASDCLYELCRLGRSDVAAEYTHLLSDNPGTLTQARIELIRAAVNDDPMSLERAANRFGEMGRQLEASECWFLAADAHRRNGDAKGSSAAATQAKRIAQHCEGAQLTTADEQKSVPILSSREYEVATLAASGQSNRQIADRLVVSERTVESHLYRVFAKLGVTTRDRLGPELERHF